MIHEKEQELEEKIALLIEFFNQEVAKTGAKCSGISIEYGYGEKKPAVKVFSQPA